MILYHGRYHKESVIIGWEKTETSVWYKLMNEAGLVFYAKQGTSDIHNS